MIEATISGAGVGGSAVGGKEVNDPVLAVAMADHNGLHGIDVLEALFHMAEPTAKCRQTAELAMQAFGSVGAVLAAGVPELTSQLGIQERIAYSLRAIHVGTHCVIRELLPERVVIGSFADLLKYIDLHLKDQPGRISRVLYLDRKNGLISDEDVKCDAVDHVPLCPRPIVKRALEHSASAVIVVSHHPSRDPQPSSAEVKFSSQLQEALGIMRIGMYDSLIIGRNSHASLRSLGHL